MNGQQNDTRVIQLPTGQLNITTHRAELPLDRICGFAARRNPKRGFLFVSKVLGKHIPVRPRDIRDIHRRLAAQIADLPGPVAVIGMAETAIALGHGVFDELVNRTCRDDLVFLQSTRYRIKNMPVALEFLEEHSHAADHIIYEPQDDEARRLFRQARSLLLVDDEASTGKTFVNLVNNMAPAMPHLERVVTCVITDWRGPERVEQTHAAMPIPCQTVAVLHGQYGFTAAPDLVAVDMPKVTGNGTPKDGLIRPRTGRLGLTANQKIDVEPQYQNVVRWCQGRRILILGTGEFAYEPFLLSEQLERAGVDVKYQSTTRSPIMTGLAIGRGLTFGDNYGDGIPNFLYNADRADYDGVIICHETPTGSVDDRLIHDLQAQTLAFV